MRNKTGKILTAILAVSLSTGMLWSGAFQVMAESDAGYSYAEEYAFDNPEEFPEENIYETVSNIYEGQSVLFGRYEQDGLQENGAEAIEWIVLGIQDGKALLISKYGLDARTYGDPQWTSSNLRSWLNSDFLYYAFDGTEQSYLAGGQDDAVGDPVFVLSNDEVGMYSTILSGYLQCMPTDAARQMLMGADPSVCRWWTRTPGTGGICVVEEYGSVDYYGLSGDQIAAVRPSIWVYASYPGWMDDYLDPAALYAPDPYGTGETQTFQEAGQEYPSTYLPETMTFQVSGTGGAGLYLMSRSALESTVLITMNEGDLFTAAALENGWVYGYYDYYGTIYTGWVPESYLIYYEESVPVYDALTEESISWEEQITPEELYDVTTEPETPTDWYEIPAWSETPADLYDVPTEQEMPADRQEETETEDFPAVDEQPAEMTPPDAWSVDIPPDESTPPDTWSVDMPPMDMITPDTGEPEKSETEETARDNDLEPALDAVIEEEIAEEEIAEEEIAEEPAEEEFNWTGYAQERAEEEYGYESGEPATGNVSWGSVADSLFWDQGRSGAAGAEYVDFNRNGEEDLLLYYFAPGSVGGYTASVLSAKLYTKEGEEVISSGSIDLMAVNGVENAWFAAGIQEINGEHFLYTELYSHAAETPGSMITYSWYSYNGEGFEKCWELTARSGADTSWTVRVFGSDTVEFCTAGDVFQLIQSELSGLGILAQSMISHPEASGYGENLPTFRDTDLLDVALFYQNLCTGSDPMTVTSQVYIAENARIPLETDMLDDAVEQ